MYKILTVFLLLLTISVQVIAQDAKEPKAEPPESEEPKLSERAKNAEDFLASLTEVDESILGKTRYLAKYMGRKIGTYEIEVEKSKWKESDCYKIISTIAIEIGEKSFKFVQNGYYSANLILVSYSAIDYRDGKIAKSNSCVLADGRYNKSWVDDLEKVQTATFDLKPRMLLESASVLMSMLVDVTEPKEFLFIDWDDELGYSDSVVKIGEKIKIGQLEGYPFINTTFELKEDSKGRMVPTEKTEECLISEEGKVLRVKFSGRPIIIELDDGRVSKDKIKLLATPLAPVLCFWVALRDKDAELFKSALNEDKYLRGIFVGDPDYKDYSEEQMNDLIEEVKKTFAKETVKDGLEEDMTALMDGISTSWFEVKLDGNNKATVSLSKEFAETTGDESEMSWDIEKDEETGFWKIIKMITDDDDF